MEALLADKLFLRMIDHKNFNPRLIELLTNADYLAIAEKPIKDIVEAVLENPRELWELPYRTHLTSEARALMLAMYFNGPTTEISALERTFERILDAMGSRLAAPDRPSAFRRSIKELEGSVLTIEERHFSFSNPGVRDFLDQVVENDRFVQFAVKVLTEYDELNQCRDVIKKSKLAQLQGAQFQRDWVDAIGRLVAGDSGTVLSRFELALDAYSRLPVPHLLVHVMTAASALDQDFTDEKEIHACQSVLEELQSAKLPSPEANEVLDLLTAFLIQSLKESAFSMNFEEVVSVADTLTDFGSTNAAIEPAIHEALEVQIQYMDQLMQGIDTLDELDNFESDFLSTLAKYNYQKKGYEYDIESLRDRILEGDIRPRSANYGSAHKQDPTVATNEEIESMFQGLLK